MVIRLELKSETSGFRNATNNGFLVVTDKHGESLKLMETSIAARKRKEVT
jgi:hypothetical protein